MKIAIFHLAFTYSGGGERLVLEEAIGFSKLGHEVVCFSPVVKKDCFPELMDQVEVKRILPKILPFWFPDKELFSILASCVLIPFLFFKFRKYDIYIGANQPGPWITYILSKLNRKPYMIYLAQPTRLVHPRLIDQKMGLRIGDGFTMINAMTKIFKPLIKYLDMKSIKNADIIFANGSYAKGLLEEVYEIEAVNVPAGAHFPKEKINIDSRFKGLIFLGKKRIRKPYVLITNRHFPQKKFEYAINAVLMLEKPLDVVITGKTTEYTKTLKIKYKNKKNIHFVGLLPQNELNNAYKNCSVYLYPSPEEDFGMGILEAMAYGVPAVAFGNAGPSGIIDHKEDGFLAKPFSTEDFSRYIDKLLNNKILYKKISKKAQIKIKTNFNYDNHVKIMMENIEKELK